jgi:guanylate kinase
MIKKFNGKIMKEIVIMCGGTASGKTTIQSELVKNHECIKVITATSRPIRPGESHEVDYYFYNTSEFKKAIDNDEFIEYERFSDSYYGTPYKSLNHQKLPIAILEPKGAKNLKELLKDKGYKVTTVFVDCPKEVQLTRVMLRDSDNPQQLEKRIKNIEENEQSWKTDLKYDLIVDGQESVENSIKKINSYLKKKPYKKIRLSNL